MIFCFSGCGNTKLVAGNLARILGEQVVDLTIRASLHHNVSAQRRVIWMFPVYSWGMPRNVIAFIEKCRLEGGENTDHFMVATCGDDAGLTDKMWRKQIKSRGWKAISAFTVIMPNTYVLLPGFNVDSTIIAQEKLSAMPDRVARVAHAIKCRSTIDDLTRGKMPWIKTRILYPLFMRFLTSPSPFHHTGTCIGCGKCSKACPMGNVTMVNGVPVWSDRCALCLACYHNCPVHSVAYGSRTKDKGQYVAPSEDTTKT